MSTARLTTATLAVPALLLGLSGLAGCGDDGRASDPVAAPSDPATSSAPASPGAHPTYAPSDYRYRLQVLCYCPLVGAVDVTVKSGKVAAATVATGARKGEQAPAYARKTINDVIAIANDPTTHAKVTWPQGAPAPSRVQVNPLTRTSDAQITYVISDLSEG